MKNNTKLLVGLGLGAAALYLIFKPKGSAASNVNQAALTKCELEYSRMARPSVMESPEYWKKREEEFIKNCVQEYVVATSTTCKEGEELVDDLYPSACTKDSINAGTCVQIPIKTCKPISKPNNDIGLDKFMRDYQPQNPCKEGEEMACGIAGCRCVPKIDKKRLPLELEEALKNAQSFSGGFKNYVSGSFFN